MFQELRGDYLLNLQQKGAEVGSLGGRGLEVSALVVFLVGMIPNYLQ